MIKQFQKPIQLFIRKRGKSVKVFDDLAEEFKEIRPVDITVLENIEKIRQLWISESFLNELEILKTQKIVGKIERFYSFEKQKQDDNPEEIFYFKSKNQEVKNIEFYSFRQLQETEKNINELKVFESEKQTVKKLEFYSFEEISKSEEFLKNIGIEKSSKQGIFVNSFYSFDKLNKNSEEVFSLVEEISLKQNEKMEDFYTFEEFAKSLAVPKEITIEGGE